MSKRWSLALASAMITLSVAACGSPGQPGAAPGEGRRPSRAGASAPYKVGLVYAKSGPLAAYGEQYRRDSPPASPTRPRARTPSRGTRSRSPSRTTRATRPRRSRRRPTSSARATIIAGSTASGVALQVAHSPKDNKILFISGPAAVDAVTGANKYTFRSGRQTYQDVATAGSMLGDVTGKKVTVLAQDSAFGKANVAGVRPSSEPRADGRLRGRAGRRHRPDPVRHEDQGRQPDLLFVAWADERRPMWTTLGSVRLDEGRHRPRHQADPPVFGESGTKINFLSHFFDGSADNAAYQAQGLEEGWCDRRPLHQRRLRRGAR